LRDVGRVAVKDFFKLLIFYISRISSDAPLGMRCRRKYCWN